MVSLLWPNLTSNARLTTFASGLDRKVYGRKTDRFTDVKLQVRKSIRSNAELSEHERASSPHL